MATWQDLDNELALWRASGRHPTFLWRDDDTHDATPQLEPLLNLSEKHQIHAHLAVIPALVDPTLTDRLSRTSHTNTLQHGYIHKNHEPLGFGASEFGEHRDIEQQRDDLQRGWSLLQRAKLPNLVAGFVPPWNRMSAATLSILPEIGYRFCSAFIGPTSDLEVAGLVSFHACVDPIRWKHGKKFRGSDKTLALVLEHLQARRCGDTTVLAPIVLLTHHLDTTSQMWEFLDQLFERLAFQDDAQWLDLAELAGQRQT